MTLSTVNPQTIENALEQMSACKLPARASACKLPARASACKLPNSSELVRPHVTLTLEDPFKVLSL